MKKIIALFFMFALLSQSVMADSYNALTFTKSDGSTQVVNVTNLVMTVSGSSLVVTNGSGSVSLSIAGLSKMNFTSTTAVEAISSSVSSGVVKVYSLGGVYMGEYSSADAAESSLNKGVYIVKSNSKTSKITVQ